MTLDNYLPKVVVVKEAVNLPEVKEAQRLVVASNGANPPAVPTDFIFVDTSPKFLCSYSNNCEFKKYGGCVFGGKYCSCRRERK